MANAEFETKWAAAPTSTSPDGATATLLLLIAGVATQVLPDNLSVGKIKTGTPASAAATGVAGQIRWDASFVYICVSTNVWKRVAIATW
jgi:hypothetical protein